MIKIYILEKFNGTRLFGEEWVSESENFDFDIIYKQYKSWKKSFPNKRFRITEMSMRTVVSDEEEK